MGEKDRVRYLFCGKLGVRQACSGRLVPASMSLGHALDWEELAAGERPG